jgi:tetratricopeptide (TPR) repeat protein
MGKLSRLVAGALIVLAVGAVQPALANKTPEQVAADKKAAKERYEAGKRAYNLGEFDTAIKEWTEGYKIGGDAIFLYNLGQAYRQKGEVKEAIRFYKSYLRESPNATNRAQVEQIIADLEKKPVQPETRPATRPVTPPETQPATRPVTPPETQPATRPVTPPTTRPVTPPETQPATQPVVPPVSGGGSPGKALKIAGLAAGGAGVALVVTGVIFGLQASSLESELNDARANHEPWSQDLADKDSKGHTASTISLVTLSVGAAAVIAGGTLFYLGMRKKAPAEKGAEDAEESAFQIVPVIGPTVAGVSLGWTF